MNENVPSRKKRILVVDDSPTILKILSAGIASLGYDVEQANDGREALAAIALNRPDLVMTDLNMPELDGFGLVTALRARPEFADLPIIVLTSVDDDAAMRRALDAGANVYLRKPAPLPKLKYKVQSLLDDAAAPRTSERAGATLKDDKAATDVLQRARQYRRVQEQEEAQARETRVALDVQIDMYLLAETNDEAQMLLRLLLKRTDLHPADVLPLLMDATRLREERLRIFRLMAEMGKADFAAPLLHLYHATHDYGQRAAMVKVIAMCGKAEFLPDLRELYDGEVSAPYRKDAEHQDLLETLERAIELAAAGEDD